MLYDVFRKSKRIVSLNLSLWPLVCEWFAEVRRCSTPRKVNKDANNLLESYTPLLVKRYVGMHYGTMHWSKKRFAMCVKLGLHVSICACYFETAICDTKERMVMLRRFKNQSVNIHCDEVEGSGCWKKWKAALMAICWIISWAIGLEIGCLAETIKFTLWRIVHAMLAEVSRNLWMTS